uniref:Uncharacterized protein n=2 Tax=Eptatretus burgeri TaxID=7764 RepID=A0A8C4QA77_EPTBU
MKLAPTKLIAQIHSFRPLSCLWNFYPLCSNSLFSQDHHDGCLSPSLVIHHPPPSAFVCPLTLPPPTFPFVCSIAISSSIPPFAHSSSWCPFTLLFIPHLPRRWIQSSIWPAELFLVAMNQPMIATPYYRHPSCQSSSFVLLLSLSLSIFISQSTSSANCSPTDLIFSSPNLVPRLTWKERENCSHLRYSVKERRGKDKWSLVTNCSGVLFHHCDFPTWLNVPDVRYHVKVCILRPRQHCTLEKSFKPLLNVVWSPPVVVPTVTGGDLLVRVLPVAPQNSVKLYPDLQWRVTAYCNDSQNEKEFAQLDQQLAEYSLIPQICSSSLTCVSAQLLSRHYVFYGESSPHVCIRVPRASHWPSEFKWFSAIFAVPVLIFLLLFLWHGVVMWKYIFSLENSTPFSLQGLEVKKCELLEGQKWQEIETNTIEVWTKSCQNEMADWIFVSVVNLHENSKVSLDTALPRHLVLDGYHPTSLAQGQDLPRPQGSEKA